MRSAYSAIGIAALVIMGFVVIDRYEKNTHQTALPEQPAANLNPFTKWSYSNNDGATISLGELNDKIWVANFIFSNCPGPCNFMSQKMARLQRDFAGDSRLHFVSISVDPERDTPEVLKAYAERYKGLTPQWWFLTGPLPETITLAKELFKLPADQDPNLHSTSFVLVDTGGRVHGIFNSDEANFHERIKGSIDQLLARAALN